MYKKIGLLILVLVMTVLCVPGMASWGCSHPYNEETERRNRYEKIDDTQCAKWYESLMRCSNCCDYWWDTEHPHNYTVSPHYGGRKNGHYEYDCPCGYKKIIHEYKVTEVTDIRGYMIIALKYKCPCGDTKYQYFR